MSSLRNILLLAFIQLLCFASVLEAYSNGSVEEACSDMLPHHEGAEPSTLPCKFSTFTDVTTIIQGSSLIVTLQNLTSSSFKGYFTMAFDASNPDSTEPLGVFGIPSDGQQLNCPGGTQNAISHAENNSRKNKVVTYWTAPADFVGTIVFKTTFVQGESTFWVKEPSNNVTVISRDAIDTTTLAPLTCPETTEPATCPTLAPLTCPETTKPATCAPTTDNAASFGLSWIAALILPLLTVTRNLQ